MRDTSANALFVLEQHLHRKTTEIPAILLGNLSITLQRGPYVPEIKQPGVAYVDGYGGFKKVYGLEDGRAMSIRNLDGIRFSTAEAAEETVQTWNRAIREEKDVSDKVIAVGLEAQHIEIETLDVNGNLLPVMVMTRFEKLTEYGMQVRDAKNMASSCGHSMLFGTPENVRDTERLKFVMQGLLNDAATAMANGLSFSGDACSLVIKDTPDTPAHDKNALGLFEDRKQQIRFFFFDFSSKTAPRNDTKLTLLDEEGNADRERIRERAARYMVTAFSVVEMAILKEEEEHIRTLASATSPGERFPMIAILEDNYNSIKESLVEDVTHKTVAAIERMPLEERLSKLQGPVEAPPLDLPGNGRAERIPINVSQQQRGV